MGASGYASIRGRTGDGNNEVARRASD